MVCRLVMVLSLWTRLSIARDYQHVTELMKEDKMILNWEVEDETLFFMLSGLTTGFVGLAFSYDDHPQDGFIAGVDRLGKSHERHLMLDFNGRIIFEINFFVISVFRYKQ